MPKCEGLNAKPRMMHVMQMSIVLNALGTNMQYSKMCRDLTARPEIMYACKRGTSGPKCK